jgi:hypothetical protein
MAATLCEQTLQVVRNLQTPFGLQRALIMSGIAQMECRNLELANDYLTESANLYARSRIAFAWYFHMPLYCAFAELRLRLSNVASAREAVEKLRAVSSRNVNFGWRARTFEVSARVAIEEGDLNRAESEIRAALELVREHDVPLVAWRVHAAASALYKQTGDLEFAQEHLGSSKSILSRFAETFDADEPLRHSIMRGRDNI